MQTKKQNLRTLFFTLFILSVLGALAIFLSGAFSSPIPFAIVTLLILIGSISAILILAIDFSLRSHLEAQSHTSHQLSDGYAGFLDVFDGLPDGFTITYKHAKSVPQVNRSKHKFNTVVSFGNGRVEISKLGTGSIWTTSEPELALLIRNPFKTDTFIGNWK